MKSTSFERVENEIIWTKALLLHRVFSQTITKVNPSWLCMKRKYMMMPALIQGPKQSGIDIDMYLRPLVDELLLLWKEKDVRVWDEYKHENFDL
jgi:hypothetical protein